MSLDYILDIHHFCFEILTFLWKRSLTIVPLLTFGGRNIKGLVDTYWKLCSNRMREEQVMLKVHACLRNHKTMWWINIIIYLRVTWKLKEKLRIRRNHWRNGRLCLELKSFSVLKKLLYNFTLSTSYKLWCFFEHKPCRSVGNVLAEILHDYTTSSAIWGISASPYSIFNSFFQLFF
jgi:hypothetical protein